jgi:hypothetical protein
MNSVSCGDIEKGVPCWIWPDPTTIKIVGEEERQTMPEYNGYSIALVEVAPTRWLSTIQRLDGRKMKSLATGETFEIWECPQVCETAEAAIEEAKVVIDSSGLGIA